MATPDYVGLTGSTGPTFEQDSQPGYPQQQPFNTDGCTDSDIHSEIFPEALNEIEEAGPVPAIERVQLAISNANPVPVIREQAAAIANQFTTNSHDLAHDSIIEGAIPLHDDRIREGVRDIGWHKLNAEIPDPLIGRLSNGKLFAMMRRFNKDVFAVRSVSPSNANGLDLNDAWSDEYVSDKVTLHLQRLYFSLVLGLASFGKQVSRLRSWKETRRTSAFCAVYFAAWFLDLLVPLMLGTLMLIISFKPARDILFPPAPRAIVNMSTGGLQDPAAGQLGTLNSLTGAPEKQESEAIEKEATNFVDNVRHLIQRAVGMHENEKNVGDPLEGMVPKPIRKGVKAIKDKGSEEGHATESNDQTQGPMEDILWNKVNPETLAKVMNIIPHVMGEIVDNWERFTNAITPTSPFSKYSFARIDAVILPLFLGSFFVNSYMIYKATGFAIGFGIFGDPVLTPFLEWLNQTHSKWVELLEPKNNILRGVPTNSQLTLTLLRIGEVHNTPLLPVPTCGPKDLDQHQSIHPDSIPLNAPRTEKLSEIQETPTTNHEKEDSKPEPKHKRLSKIIRIFKGHTESAVETKLAIDHVRAKAGSDKAKGHLGVLPTPKNLIYAGPSYFKARYDGKQGWLYITEGSDPLLLYTTKDPRPENIQTENLKPIVEIDVNGIKQLKREAASIGKVAEKAADWSSEKELLSSVEIDDAEGTTWRFTAVPERDELFNRLIALGRQRWENL